MFAYMLNILMYQLVECLLVGRRCGYKTKIKKIYGAVHIGVARITNYCAHVLVAFG